MKPYELVVIGGGFAGVSAALAAARGGCSVLLADKGNCLGGAAVNGLVNPFMRNQMRLGERTVELSAGIFEEIRQRLRERGAMRGNSFLEEELKLVLGDMVAEAGVDLLFHAYLCGTEHRGGRLVAATFATRGRNLTVGADYFVDATGDAQLAFLAGCPTVLGREPDHLCQPMTLCFRLGNVDVERFFASRERWTAAHKAALESGALQNPREDILVFQTPVPNVLHFNTTRVVRLDPTDPEDVTKAEVLARQQVREIYDLLKQNADGLENSFLMMTASEIGVRESRMIVGDYRLTEQDCKACRRFEDAIAVCNYDIDIHNPDGSGTSHYFFPAGKYYTIPYRCLIPQTLENLLVTGRCISSDHGAQASYRIMPTVCCLGEAAGSAIALAARDHTGVRAVDVKALQALLKQNGAFLGG